MSLAVCVKNACNLPNFKRLTKPDPMVVVAFQGVKQKTKVVKKTVDPVWDEIFQWTFQTTPSKSDVVWFEVLDHETIGENLLIGKGEISLCDVMAKGSYHPELKLKGRKENLLQSSLLLDIKYTAPASNNTSGSKKALTGQALGEPEEEVGREDARDCEEDELGEDGGIIAPCDLSSVDTICDQEKQRREKARAKLSDESTDFQIQLHVIEARKLQGGGLNTVVRVSCGSQVKWTKSRRGTINPFFDEILFFKVTEHPKNLFEMMVKISAHNSQALVHDSLIGSCEFNIGMAYDVLGSGFMHKWALLSDPDHPSRGSQGYLKFSISITVPSENPTQSLSIISPDLVDKESNLLDPSGVRPKGKSLNIKIYQAEGLPQMDPDQYFGVKNLKTGTAEKTGLVDPYCVLEFAGHVGKTHVIWKDHDPVWNKQFNFSIMFPSMCERIKFQLMDKNKLGKDDPIGTFFLRLADISSPAETGFLPSFGPTFVNIYGSLREFTNLPDELGYLNKGEVEGVSYRGRVMVEVNMEKDKDPTPSYEDVKERDMNKLTPFLRRRRYKLFATFFSATMIKPAHEAVKFEVSIGNYGDIQETDYPIQSSTTPPAHPLLYGSSFYYIPWMHQMPCVNVESQWEDNTYRIESQNLLLFIAEGLRKSLERVQKMKVQERHSHRCRNILIEAIQLAMGHIRQGIPELPPAAYTNLDKLKHSAREEELSLMLDAARKLLRTKEGELKDDLTFKDLNAKARDFYARLMELANEPQNSVPDVIIWMLSGQKRVAYYRIPSHQVMYSASEKTRGSLYGKILNIMLKPPAQEEEKLKGANPPRALVRCAIRLGLEQDLNKWGGVDREGEVEFFAETYENQVLNTSTKNWESPGKTWLEWSDCEGKRMSCKDDFEPSPGWEWKGEWYFSPVFAINEDEYREELEEEIFELQEKKPNGIWPITMSESKWRNIENKEVKDSKENPLPKGDTHLTEGSVWSNVWRVDTNRACDEEGWEYMYCVDSNTGRKPFEKNSHERRQRRWFRTRIYNRSIIQMELPDEGWEYAKSCEMSYHCNKRSSDMARRRRWLRKVDQTAPGHLNNVFLVKCNDNKSRVFLQSPQIFISFKEPHKYQLRAYIYLAIDLHAIPKLGLTSTDPYCVVSFDRFGSQCTHTISDTLYPVWDQTLIFDNVCLFGEPSAVQKSSPLLAVEVYDREITGQDMFLGIVMITPVVKLIPDSLQPSLEWHEIMRYGQPAGKLLASCELLLDKAIDDSYELLIEEPTNNPVPDGIRPTYKRIGIMVHCHGIRDFQMMTAPFAKIQYGKKIEKTASIKSVLKNPNFPNPLVTMEVNLPNEENHSPPFTIMLYDDHGYGQSVVIGTAYIEKTLYDFIEMNSLGNVKEFRFHQTETGTELEETDGMNDSEHFKFDWWSKYYASISDEKMKNQEYINQGHDLLEVYNCELEDEFNDFEDYLKAYPLLKENSTCDPRSIECQTVGYLKAAIVVYPLPEDGSLGSLINLGSGSHFPPSEPIEVEVRIYIIKGIDLQPEYKDKKCEPYLVVSLGEEEVANDKENYKSSTCNPLFGKMFKVHATLPLNSKLRVKVMNHDRDTSANDLIGETMIDLENRFFSQYRPICGLPQSFSRHGPNKWRDCMLPKDILNWYCKTQGLSDPVWNSSEEVEVNKKTYNIKNIDHKHEPTYHQGHLYPDQRLALHILHEQGLVPEHVETRNLYHPMNPGRSQGKLHMWVDIFPNSSSSNLPDPVDITYQDPTSPTEVLTAEPPQLKDVFKLLKHKSYNWQSIGQSLMTPFDHRQSLERKGTMMSDQDKLEDVLNQWIQTRCSEVSWRHFIEVLKELKFNDVVEDVKSFLKSAEAVNKYNYHKGDLSD